MRVFLLVALLVAAALPASSAHGASGGFGVGDPTFSTYPLPSNLADAHNSGEPTIGIPWSGPGKDHVFFQSFAHTAKAVFTNATVAGQADNVTWTNVTPLFTVTNVDPMLHADPVTGRIWAGGLAGPCSLMGISDDDGATWVPAGNMCGGAQFDHQSIGSGPWANDPTGIARDAVYPRATYYCSQLAATACSTSLNGGLAWTPFTEITGGCGGLHGHIKVSEVTGFAAVPDSSCGGGENPVPLPGSTNVGFGYTDNNGLTWGSRVMPDSAAGNDFDPALDFSRESGWLWLAQADALGVHIAMSKDQGVSWETLGATTPNSSPSTWFNLNNTFVDPVTHHGLVYGTFPDVVAGDDLRAAVSFMATTDPTGTGPFSDCSDGSSKNIWHYYLTVTYDGGATWETSRISDDPVQIGAIWSGGGSDPCRNLLDFNDADIDSVGRIHVGFSDGCTQGCAQTYFDYVGGKGDAPTSSQSRDALGTLFRQTGGRGLFAAYDGTPIPEPTPAPTTTTNKGSPGFSGPLMVAGLVAAVLVLRRKT